MRASWRSSSLNAVSITRCADLHAVQARSTAPGSARCRRCRPTQPRGAGASTAKPTAGTVCAARQHLDAPAAELERLRRSRTAPAPASACSALGRRVKSGQMTPLKMCVRSAVERLRQRMHLDRRAALARAAHHAVGQQADRQHVVEVRVADQDVVDRAPARRASGRRRRCRRRSGRRRRAGTRSSCSRRRSSLNSRGRGSIMRWM